MKCFFKLFLLVLLCHLNVSLFSQDSTSTKERKIFNAELIEIGAGLGLDAFGSSGLLLGIQPTFIYTIIERVHLGINPNLIYYRDFISSVDDIRYGAGIFGRGYFSENFYGHLEFEELNAQRNLNAPRNWIPSLMLGIGYKKKIDFINTYVTTLYILNYRNFSSPYPRPIVIRAGATVLLSELFTKK